MIRDLLHYNDRLERRELSEIDLVVVHSTELPSLGEARVYGERMLHPESRTGNSGHYYVDRDGGIVQYVEDDRVAHHAKESNRRSIGIELVNRGRYPDWFRSTGQEPTEEFPEAQVAALVGLLADLRKRLPGLVYLARHADLDTALVPASDDPSLRVRRKIDPGPRFPWERVLAASGLKPLGAGVPSPLP